jgi:hypothetical protein
LYCDGSIILINVEGHPNLVRDASGAIINISKTEVQEAKARKELIQKRKLEQQNLKDSVASLQSDMAEMKLMLSKIVERL